MYMYIRAVQFGMYERGVWSGGQFTPTIKQLYYLICIIMMGFSGFEGETGNLRAHFPSGGGGVQLRVFEKLANRCCRVCAADMEI